MDYLDIGPFVQKGLGSYLAAVPVEYMIPQVPYNNAVNYGPNGYGGGRYQNNKQGHGKRGTGLKCEDKLKCKDRRESNFLNATYLQQHSPIAMCLCPAERNSGGGGWLSCIPDSGLVKIYSGIFRAAGWLSCILGVQDHREGAVAQGRREGAVVQVRGEGAVVQVAGEGNVQARDAGEGVVQERRAEGVVQDLGEQ